MYCSKCGSEIQDSADFCSVCGEKQNNAQQTPIDTASSTVVKKNSKIPIILLSIGAGLALLIFLISWIVYGRVYFFNGYAITTVGWIASFLLVIVGIVLSVLNLTKHKIGKRQIIAFISLVAVIPVVLVCSSLINGEKETSSSSSYYGSPSYIRDTFESCHSTAEHKQAFYSYDLNNDNYMSEYELELFFDAHPRVVQDKQFIQWVESMMD